jgi:hypothetical protein
MVGSLPPIRHVIAITAKDQQGRSSACEHDQTFFVFFLKVGGIGAQPLIFWKSSDVPPFSPSLCTALRPRM